jgi:hypothetical protein
MSMVMARRKNSIALMSRVQVMASDPSIITRV